MSAKPFFIRKNQEISFMFHLMGKQFKADVIPFILGEAVLPDLQHKVREVSRVFGTSAGSARLDIDR